MGILFFRLFLSFFLAGIGAFALMAALRLFEEEPLAELMFAGGMIFVLLSYLLLATASLCALAGLAFKAIATAFSRKARLFRLVNYLNLRKANLERRHALDRRAIERKSSRRIDYLLETDTRQEVRQLARSFRGELRRAGNEIARHRRHELMQAIVLGIKEKSAEKLLQLREEMSKCAGRRVRRKRQTAR